MKFFQHDPNQQKLNTKIIHHEYGPDNPEYGYPDEVRDALLDDVPPQPDILIKYFGITNISHRFTSKVVIFSKKVENIILETGIKGKVQIDVCNSLAKEGLKAHTYDNGDVTLTVNKELLETTSGVDIRRALVSNPLLYKKFK